MNVWGVLRIVARRWYVAGPVLIAACVLAYMQGKKVQPIYTAQAYATLQGPTVVTQTVPGTNGETKSVQVNPLLGGGGGTVPAGVTTQLLLVESGGPARVDAVKAGVSPAYTITTQPKSSVMVIACATKSAKLSLASVQFGIDHLQKTLNASQQAFLNQPTERVTLQTLIPPEIISAKASKRRIELVVAGIGALAAILLALLLEALMIGRRRRRDRKLLRADDLDSRVSSPALERRVPSRADSQLDALNDHDLAPHGYVTAHDDSPVVPSPHD